MVGMLLVTLGMVTVRRKYEKLSKALSYLHFVALQSTLILIVGLGSFFCHLFLQMRPAAKKYVVDKGILQQSQKDKDKATHEVNVNGFDIRDLGKCLPKVGVDGGHCQHRGYTCREGHGGVKGPLKKHLSARVYTEGKDCAIKSHFTDMTKFILANIIDSLLKKKVGKKTN